MRFLKMAFIVFLLCYTAPAVGESLLAAPDSREPLSEDLKAGITFLLFYSALNAAGSHDPKAYGETMIGLSPLMAGFAMDSPQSDIFDALIVGGVFSAFGLYNRNILAKGDYSKSEIFGRDTLLTTVPMMGILIYDHVSRNRKSSSEAPPFSIQSDGSTTLLCFNKRL